MATTQAAAKFKIGDKVDFRNEYGILFVGKTVRKVEATEDGHRYYVTPSDCPWVPRRESSLTLSF